MRIAFVVGSFPKLSETFILNQITGLLDAGHDVRIFALENPDEDRVHSVVDKYDLLKRTRYIPQIQSYKDAVGTLLGTVPSILTEQLSSITDVLSLGTTGKRAPKQLEILNLLSDSKPFDICHAHFGPVGEVVQPAVAELDVPFIVSFYGSDISRDVKGNVSRYQPLFESTAAVTALSNDMKNRLVECGCNGSKVYHQPVAIDVEDYAFRERSRSTNEPVKIITVARFVEKKGVEYAIDAIASLDDEFPIHYQLVGDGPLREEIEQKIESYGLEESINLTGYVQHTEMKDLIDESHIFVLPSVTAQDGDQEGTPTVLLEAQASGLPIVSTQHAGIPEIVSDQEAGLLVPERDSKALADALRQLIKSESDWADMGHAGREYVENNHSIPHVTDGLESLYEDIV